MAGRRYSHGPTSGCGVARAMAELHGKDRTIMKGMLADRQRHSSRDVKLAFRELAAGPVTSGISIQTIGIHRRQDCTCY